MNVKGLFKQRCAIKRAIVTYADGTPVSTWGRVYDNLPCMLVAGPYGPDEIQVTTDSAKRQATLFVASDADIKPDDRITMRGRTVGKYKVLPQGGQVADMNGQPHHGELQVEEIA